MEPVAGREVPDHGAVVLCRREPLAVRAERDAVGLLDAFERLADRLSGANVANLHLVAGARHLPAVGAEGQPEDRDLAEEQPLGQQPPGRDVVRT